MIPNNALHCWCGNTRLEEFSEDYWLCPECQTLIARRRPKQNLANVGQDETGLYGEAYWFAHQEQNLRQPTIVERARVDLTDRCLWWLRALLKFRVPPARVLELGSAHGGFVALLRQSGFDATGLELSPAIARFARETFDVPMLEGPIEQQALPPGSLDVIALMDVLEHLADPIGTIRRCFEVLTPDGLLLVQTPRLPGTQRFAELTKRQDPFLRMLQPQEHLYLFSESALALFFDRLGAGVVFEPAIFSHYDMCAVISRGPLHTLAPEAANQALLARPQGRLVLALLDLEARTRSLAERLERTAGDLTFRDEQLDQALRWVREADGHNAARLIQVEILKTSIRESEADRLARGEQIGTLTQALNDSEADRRARSEQISTLTQALNDSEADRRARSEQISTLTQALDDSETDRRARWDQIQALTASLIELEGERGQLSEVRSRLQAVELSALQSAGRVRELEAAVKASKEDATRAIAVLHTLRGSRWYRLLVGTGRWTQLDAVIRQLGAASVDEEQSVALSSGITMLERDLKRVAVDLTPVLPGGENGGAKVFTLNLIRELAKMAPACEFVVLTSALSHDELVILDARNVRRVCVVGLPSGGPRSRARGFALLEKAASRVVPKRLRLRLREAIGSGRRRISRRLLAGMKIDVLLCPFTAPYYDEPGIPCVSVIYDLQHRTYPEFFDRAERSERERTFQKVCNSADHLICISGYVRDKVLEHGTASADRVSVVPLCPMPHGPVAHMRSESIDVGKAQGLLRGRYLLYPANFWRHKNHEILLIALAGFRARHSDSNLRLVCTGSPGPRLEWLRDVSARMGLRETVLFAGYVPDAAYQELLDGCRALVFPSLYEGFGMPVVEAMAAGRPVACSSTTSLPEVTAGAALLFDPRKPDEIVQAIERVEFDESLRRDLIERGSARAAALGVVEDVARQYLQVLSAARKGQRRYVDGITGLYDDNWTTDQLVVTYAGSKVSRRVELDFVAPAWTSVRHLTIEVRGADVTGQRLRVGKGERCTVVVDLPLSPGHFQLAIAPLSQPAAYGLGSDDRLLGCLCESCRFVMRGVPKDLLARTA